MKRHVLISAIGTTLDVGKGPDRWSRWRPTVSLHQHEDLLIERTILLYGRRATTLSKLLADDIALVSPETEVERVLFDPRDPWDFEEVYEALSAFARERDFDPAADDTLIHLTTGTHVFQICAFLLAESRHIPGKLIQSSPPAKKEALPGNYSIIDLDLSRYDRLAQRFESEREEGTSFLRGGIETRNAAYGAMIDRMEKVAVRSTAPLLLTGPTGAGKSVLARRLYELKRARHVVEGEFVRLNCATLRGEETVPQLFGQKRGWHGAASERRGLLRAADKGVLFLDEIEQLGPDDQALLLDAVETGRFYPLGADRPSESRFQLIAGTSENLARLVADGSFRADLYARLNLWTFRLPGLAERREDIEANLELELTKATREAGGKIALAADARAAYLRFATDPAAPWSGNFRDLAASASRMATLAERGRVTKGLVEEECALLRRQWAGTARDEDADVIAAAIGDPEAASRLDRFDLVQLADVIRVCQTSRTLSEAGRVLFAASRKKKASANDADRLKKYLARFGLEFGELSV
ncbi:RNA repair transcriptional activator RtcR [Parvularcula dongshanensis]|uniref:Transcriptional regulatory protein RtcR n=1 Tax=Parvularcula dongshanensis TaxID=1173995 RepID=A0A840I711_9PROT|nr:RNA repair transcriptional activator RtcR [Parvularcula dongshanensis]MBB4660282.1 transcriptional regulatory protein RtcR [Parvularcula dongshanensis]